MLRKPAGAPNACGALNRSDRQGRRRLAFMALKEGPHFTLRVILHSLAGVELAVAGVADSQRYGREFEDAESAAGHGTSCHNARVTAGYQQLSIMSFAFENCLSPAACSVRNEHSAISAVSQITGLPTKLAFTVYHQCFASSKQIERALNLSKQDGASYTDVRI